MSHSKLGFADARVMPMPTNGQWTMDIIFSCQEKNEHLHSLIDYRTTSHRAELTQLIDTMASLGNHKSSVSALQAKLGAFARELDETMLLSSASISGTTTQLNSCVYHP
jgi:hypothetical protein